AEGCSLMVQESLREGDRRVLRWAIKTRRWHGSLQREGAMVQEVSRILMQSLRDRDLHIMASAAGALGHLNRGKEAVEVLVRGLKDRSPRRRCNCLFALRELAWRDETRAAVPDLLHRLQDESARVRAAAAVVLKEIGEPVPA